MAVTVTLKAQLSVDPSGFASVMVGELPGDDVTDAGVNRATIIFPLTMVIGGTLDPKLPATVTISQ